MTKKTKHKKKKPFELTFPRVDIQSLYFAKLSSIIFVYFQLVPVHQDYIIRPLNITSYLALNWDKSSLQISAIYLFYSA